MNVYLRSILSMEHKERKRILRRSKSYLGQPFNFTLLTKIIEVIERLEFDETY